MKNGRHANKTTSKIFAVAVAVALVLCMVVGGTLAWLSDKTDPVVNTFSPSTIDIDLTETLPANRTAQMIPGYTIAKDPTVTVKANSEKCYLFVKIEKSANFDTYMTYTPATGWTELTDGSGVFYRIVDKKDTNQSFAVLANDQVTVKSTVTKADMEALTTASYPTLTFTAYAVQYNNSNEGHFEPADAWDEAQVVAANA